VEFIASNGGSILDEDGNAVVDSYENMEALQFMKDLIHRYEISPPNTFTEMKEEEVRTFFQSGKALFERNWPYAWKLHEREDSEIKGKVEISVLPKFKGGQHAATLGGWHIGMSRFSDSKAEAWELVKYIMSFDTQKGLMLNLGWNPGRKDIYDDAEIREKMPHIEVLKRAFGYAVARPSLPAYTQISEILQREVNSAIAGKIEPADALKQAQEEIKKVLRTYGE
jgi:multiple sugar transport system substrate-binding protein